jgi:hypothetical protein
MRQLRETYLIEMNSHCIVVVSGGLVRNNCVAVMTLSLFGFSVLKLDLEHINIVFSTFNFNFCYIKLGSEKSKNISLHNHYFIIVEINVLIKLFNVLYLLLWNIVLHHLKKIANYLW